MKKYNIKPIIITALVTSIFTIGILTLTNTLGATNNVIYTRDELSEKVEDLKENNDFIALSTSTVPTISLNELSDLSGVSCFRVNNNNVFQCNNDSIIIKKTGVYKIFVNSYSTHTALPYQMEVYVTIDDQIWNSFLLTSDSSYTSSNTMQGAIALNENQEIKIRIRSNTAISFFKTSLFVDFISSNTTNN